MKKANQLVIKLGFAFTGILFSNVIVAETTLIRAEPAAEPVRTVYVKTESEKNLIKKKAFLLD